MQQESLFISFQDYQLHLRHISVKDGGVPVLMVHGAVENGKIFYTNSGKGLGSFLARQGFDVYVLDLRGRGQSSPKIDRHADYGQTETIVDDIPAVINFITDRCEQSCHLVAHSWGGVLLASSLARFPELRHQVRSKVCFGTKRSVSVHNPERWLKVDFVWKYLAPKLAAKAGYLDALKLRIGSDSETVASLRDSIAWVKPSRWQDPNDQFNYADAAQKLDWPPIWHIAAKKDGVLGHPRDVKRFAYECVADSKEFKFSLLAKKQGNQHDYDHINMLTHPSAEKDHFPSVAEWLKQHS